MTQTLAIYDNTGFIISQIMDSSGREPIGLPFMWVDIPQNKSLVRIDTSKNPHVPVFNDVILPYDPVKWEELNVKVLQLASKVSTVDQTALNNTIVIMKGLAEVYEKMIAIQIKAGG